MEKIVINKCYGDFSLSEKAMIELGWNSEEEEGYSFSEKIARNNPCLVEIVGRYNASGELANLKVVEIPDGVKWKIEEYDGIEWVAEVHRTWG
jgi:hypothetical protein